MCCFFPPSLSQEGLFNLLDSIEGRLHCEQAGVYGESSIDGGRLNRIIRYAIPVFPTNFTILSASPPFTPA